MVRCPKCGKMNQDTSRFCNECGVTLPQTRIRCPQCGLMNPIGNVFCGRCNTRLLSTEMQFPETPKPAQGTPKPAQGTPVSVKGISLPTLLPIDPTEPAELPDWLLELTEEALGGTAAATTETTASADRFPDWLSGLADETTDSRAADAPEEEAALSPAPAELPDWLSDLKAEMSAPDEPAASATPDWFADFIADEPVAAEEAEPLEALPDWLSGVTAAREAAPAEARWEAAAPAANFAPEPPAEFPDWLLANADATSSGAPSGPHPLPDWLLANAEESTPRLETDARELPNWLRQDAERVPTPPRLEPAAAPPSPSAAASTAAKTVPDWFAGMLDEEPAPQSAALTAEPAAAEAVPDWLAGIFDEEPASQTAAFTEAPAAKAAPDWLAGVLITDAAREETPLQAPFTAEEIPDWLSGLGEEPRAAAETSTAQPDTGSSIFVDAAASEDSDAHQPRRAATPDWLKGITPPSEVSMTPAAPAFISKASVSDTESGGEEMALFGESAVLEGALQTEAMPDWLKGLAPIQPGQLAVEEKAAFEEETLVRAEVPVWLQNLRPPGTGPLPSLPESAAPGAKISAAEGGLTRAEIPDWVQQLRPVPSAAGEKAAFREPAETEGPLTGLAGVLPAGLQMDMPADFHVALPPALPESIIAQAQLWQQLLEQPRSIQRPVAQHRASSGGGEMAARWIVTVILTAVTILGLLWGNTRMSQALSSPHVERFSTAIDNLQPGATVIVAVEYGPAEAGEMTFLAEATLHHLTDKDARVLMVSTVPEGGGIIQGLLAQARLSTPLPKGQTTYLPGGASGVALFLNTVKNADLLVVLTARAEPLRWWIEQNNAAQALPTNIGVSASVGPLAAPYLETSPVEGWLVGFPDVVAYREFRGLLRGTFESALEARMVNRQLDALMLAHWAATALLLFGLFYYLALGKKGAS